MGEAINNFFSAKHIPKVGGRLPGLYTYDIVTYKEKEYAVITIQHKDKEVRFVIDNCNLTEVLKKSWHLSSGKYIATNCSLNGKNKEIYLHNYIKVNCMNEPEDKIITHINHNMLDNRVENLRVVDSSEYFPSRKNSKRTTALPPDSGFTVDDIPKYVSFMKESGEHGHRFAIEIPQINLYMKLPSSKKIALHDKFEYAKQRLNEIYKNYPNINPAINDVLKIELNTSFEYILNHSPP